MSDFVENCVRMSSSIPQGNKKQFQFTSYLYVPCMFLKKCFHPTFENVLCYILTWSAEGGVAPGWAEQASPVSTGTVTAWEATLSNYQIIFKGIWYYIEPLS